MGKCVEAWVFVHVPAVQLFNWTWHGTRNKQQQLGWFCFCLTFCCFFCLKKCFLFFSICRCWQACQIVRQIQRKAPSYRIFKMMIKQIAMMRMTIKYCWWLKVPSNIFQDLNCHQRYTHSRKILCFVTSAPLLLLRSWVALSFKVVGLSGIGNTRPNLHFF